MRIAFTKMEGCGNDYIYVDAIGSRFPVERAGELARSWSRPHFGVGSDGLILLERGDVAPLRMLMWNADGSRAEMCGNGLRCIARFAAARGHANGRSFVVETDAGPRSVELLGDLIGDGDVRAGMGEVTCGPVRHVAVAGQRLALVPGSAGNPHAVVFVEDLQAVDVGRLGAALQDHSEFEGGVNVEFVQVLGPDRLRQRTFERGSGETMACGTGAAVAVVAARQLGKTRGHQTQVELSGGTLTVAGIGPSLAIVGPARTVFCGEIELSS